MFFLESKVYGVVNNIIVLRLLCIGEEKFVQLEKYSLKLNFNF